MKRALKWLIPILLLLLFRGTIYRAIIKYQINSDRSAIQLTNPDLIKKIHELPDYETMNINDIVNASNELTASELNFVFRQAPSDPNVLVDIHSTNCVGYSSMFNSVANYLISEYGLGQKYVAKHHVSELYALNWNIHQLFSNSFFQNHDMNSIEDIETGEIVYIDPVVYDYFLINHISIKEI